MKKVVPILLVLLMLAALCSAGCGKKGKLYPRDRLKYNEDELPPEWRATPDANQPEAAIGIDGVIAPPTDAAGETTPEPTPPPDQGEDAGESPSEGDDS